VPYRGLVEQHSPGLAGPALGIIQYGSINKRLKPFQISSHLKGSRLMHTKRHVAGVAAEKAAKEAIWLHHVDQA
jgi:hypothetical protein